MIDFAKIRLRGRRHRHYRRALRLHPLLKWRDPIRPIDHPPSGCTEVATWRAWKFYAKGAEVIEIRGSFHMDHHHGTNWQDFTHAQFVSTVQDLCDTFHLFPGALHFLNLEVGVNITPPIPTREIIDRILFHRMQRPEKWDAPAIGIKIVHEGHYRYKVYDKAAQYGLPDEWMRVELHVDRMDILHRLGIKTAADLLDPASWDRLGAFLLDKWNELFIVEADIDPALVRRPQAELLAKAGDYSIWQGLSANKRSRKRAKVERLWKKHARPCLKADIGRRIMAKVEELTGLNPMGGYST